RNRPERKNLRHRSDICAEHQHRWLGLSHRTLAERNAAHRLPETHVVGIDRHAWCRSLDRSLRNPTGWHQHRTLERYSPASLSRIAARRQTGEAGRDRALRFESRSVRCSSIDERKPPSPDRFLAQLHSVAEELLLWRSRCRRNSKGRAYLPRAGLSRRRAPKRDPTSAPLMPSTLRILIIAGIFSLTAMSARAAAEIVIAIRYLQAEGNSHSHLYLY